MPNPLTGDFEAVLQVSAGTINRLLASMHQNAFAQPNLPSFPHSASMRIGDDRMIDGVRGRVQAQIAVPRIELIHGATDRFVLEVGVRAWYTPDHGTEPFPAYIHGQVRAEYRIEDIDPECFGWAGIAADYLWLRVVPNSVRFHGTANEEWGGEAVALAGADPAALHAATEAKIAGQIAVLLATRFEARPHRVTPEFRRGRLRSLKAPIGGSAVATPLGLSGEPAGSIASIDNLLLEGRDIAIGVTREVVLSLTHPALAALAAFKTTIGLHVSGPFGEVATVYRVHLNPPTVAWEPHGSGSLAVIKIKVSGGAQTDSFLADATFDVTQDVTVNFGANEKLWLAPGSLTITTHASGVGSGEIAAAIQGAVPAAVAPLVQSACNDAQPVLDAMIARKQRLIAQLLTFDQPASARLDQALFLRDGMILRGSISLAPRRAPVVSFQKTAEHDGFSALQTWIPGGRIDSFEWSWIWIGERDPGAATHDDRFVLRRRRGRYGRWGGQIRLSQRLPGLDGSGRICLRVTGVQVHPVTGELVPVDSIRRCSRFGLNVSISPEGHGRLFLRDLPELSQGVPFPELALVEARAAGDPATATNTLLLYADRSWDDETAAALRGGLNACRRGDAGLVLLVLLAEWVLAAGGRRATRAVEELTSELGLAALVNDDVRGGWSAAFALRPGEPGWRLISPQGKVTWQYQGRITSELLASALDEHLVRSAPPKPGRIDAGVDVGTQVSVAALDPGFLGGLQRHCPPPPLGQAGFGDSVVTFVQRSSASSEAQLRKLTSLYGRRREDGRRVLVIVDGADDREVERMKDELGLDFATFPDRAGIVTDQCGIRVWPTTVMLDKTGTVSEIEIGANAAPDDRASDRKTW